MVERRCDRRRHLAERLCAGFVEHEVVAGDDVVPAHEPKADERAPFAELESLVDHHVFRAGFEGRATINRKDWGIEYNAVLETGGVLISDKINLEFDVSAIKTLPV